MDETLELRLIESCYDPAKARQVSLQKAGEIIRDEIFGSARDNPAGALYFDGWAQVIVRTGLGHSIMNRQSLAVTGGDVRKGLFVYSVQDDLEGQRSSVFVEGSEGYCVLVKIREGCSPKNYLDLLVKTENEVRDSAKVEITKEGTRILYLPKVGIVQKDKLFWKHVADRCGLRLTEIEPQYTGKAPLTPWYTARHKESGVVLTLGTRNSVYAVKAEFPEAKGAAQLRELVNGLHVSPQTVDGHWTANRMPESGRQCETHIDLGLGNDVVAYIDRLLGNQELVPSSAK